MADYIFQNYLEIANLCLSLSHNKKIVYKKNICLIRQHIIFDFILLLNSEASGLVFVKIKNFPK